MWRQERKIEKAGIPLAGPVAGLEGRPYDHSVHGEDKLKMPNDVWWKADEDAMRMILDNDRLHSRAYVSCG